MDKYTEEQKKAFTSHLISILKVTSKASIFKAMNINKRTLDNRLITQKWKDHEIWYYQQTFNF